MKLAPRAWSDPAKVEVAVEDEFRAPVIESGPTTVSAPLTDEEAREAKPACKVERPLTASVDEAERAAVWTAPEKMEVAVVEVARSTGASR